MAHEQSKFTIRYRPSSFFASHQQYSLILLFINLNKPSRIFVSNLNHSLSYRISSYHLTTGRRETKKYQSNSGYIKRPGVDEIWANKRSIQHIGDYFQQIWRKQKQTSKCYTINLSKAKTSFKHLQYAIIKPFQHGKKVLISNTHVWGIKDGSNLQTICKN